MADDQDKRQDATDDVDDGVDRGRRAFLQRSGLLMAGLVLGAKLGNSPQQQADTTAQQQSTPSNTKQNTGRRKYDDDLDRVGMPGGK